MIESTKCTFLLHCIRIVVVLFHGFVIYLLAICRRGCQNGGKCVSKNRCSCPQGFRGRRCHKGTFIIWKCLYSL